MNDKIGPIKNRVVGHGFEAPDQLLANPHNFRRHPGHQLDALRGSLRELGWVKEGAIVNRQTGHVIDGHARVEEALRQGLDKIPVTYVDLSPNEERLALAMLDPISGLAYTDDAALKALVESCAAEDAAVTGFLVQLQEQASGVAPPPEEAPESFKEVGEDIETEHKCPKCGYEWSGGSAS